MGKSKNRRGGKNAGLSIPKKPQSSEEKKRLLAMLSSKVTRVNVKDETGAMKWRLIADLRDTDTLVIKSDGTPNSQEGRPGRRPAPKKPKVALQPANAVVEEVNRVREKFLKTEPLTRQIEKNFESIEVLKYTMLKMAESAAAIEFEMKEAMRLGQPVSQLARRHAIILTSIRDASVKRIDQKLKNQEVDIESQAFQNVFILIIHTIRDAMVRAGMDPEMISLVIGEFAKVVETEEWRQRALKEMKGDAVASVN